MISLGIIRIFFMFSVLNSHNYFNNYLWDNFIPGSYAVKLSFILSGFYMQMVYPKYKNAFSFYFSRIVRLYPCYWLVLLFTIFLQKIKKIHFYYLINKTLSPMSSRLIKFSNIFLLFQDDLFFFYQNKKGKLSFIGNTHYSKLHTFIIDPPTWSLGLEIKYYILIPFLANLSNFILFIIFSFSYVLRSYCYTIQKRRLDFTNPFFYRFFPNELLLFISGQFSYRFYINNQLFLKRLTLNPIIPLLCFCFLILFYSSYFFYTGINYLNLLFILLLPYFFFVSKDSTIDRWLSERVYSIYIWHIFFQKIILMYFHPRLIKGKIFLIIQFSICFLFSILFEKFIQAPLNAFLKPKKSQKSKIQENDELVLLEDKATKIQETEGQVFYQFLKVSDTN